MSWRQFLVTGVKILGNSTIGLSYLHHANKRYNGNSDPKTKS